MPVTTPPIWSLSCAGTEEIEIPCTLRHGGPCGGPACDNRTVTCPGCDDCDLDPEDHPYDGDGTDPCARCGTSCNAHLTFTAHLGIPPVEDTP